MEVEVEVVEEEEGEEEEQEEGRTGWMRRSGRKLWSLARKGKKGRLENSER